MSNKVRSITRARQKRAGKDYEQLAKKQREKRVENCDKAINKYMADFNCQMMAVVQVGNQLVPVASLLNLPIVILISSK